MKAVLLSLVCLLLVSSMVCADNFGSGDNQFTIDFVNISKTTNPTYYAVGYDYRMGQFEITVDQWNQFKNNLGIPVTGSPSYAYDVNPSTSGTKPVNNVSWFEAAQFVNWLNTSTGHSPAYKFVGTQGTSDYSLEIWKAGDDGYNEGYPYRNSNAYYFLPTESEWIKAGYWNGSELQDYATKAGEQVYQGNGSNGGWNYTDIIPAYFGPWAVGSSSEELNGTFDMMGNVYEWTESTLAFGGDYASIAGRIIKGGCYGSTDAGYMRWYDSIETGPEAEAEAIGFRVASVPEPTTLGLMVLGGLGALRRRRGQGESG